MTSAVRRVRRPSARVALLLLVGILPAAPVAARAQQGQAHPQQPSGKEGANGASAANPRNDDLQPAHLPALPHGMTLDDITAGDALFHGRAGCYVCHGVEAQGLPAAGDGITAGLSYVPYQWDAIAALVRNGLPDVESRSPIAMPARGARGDLTPDEIRRVSAYVWAISQTRGEPWAGGHELHAAFVATPAAATGTAASLPRPPERVPAARRRPDAGTGAPSAVGARAHAANRAGGGR